MKWFKMSEFFKSDSHPSLVEKPKEDSVIWKNLIALGDNLLDPIREKIEMPMVITSGYRCEKLNKAVGGSKTSNHMTGCAADVICKDRLAMVKAMIDLDLDFDECIIEGAKLKHGKIIDCRWVHFAYRDDGTNRKKMLYTFDFQTYYKFKPDMLC